MHLREEVKDMKSLIEKVNPLRLVSVPYVLVKWLN